MDSNGTLIASYGDPQAVAFLRTSAKPFQAIPFAEQGGVEHFGYTAGELVITCASHEGSAMRGLSLENYLDPDHPIQQDILASFSEMCLIPSGQISLGIDGCSAPNFAIPLSNAARAMARLCDPREPDQTRAAVCQKITAAMTAHRHGERIRRIRL